MLQTAFKNSYWFKSYVHSKCVALFRSPDYQTSFKSIGLSVQKKKRKRDFQDGGHLGFPIGMILANFDLQVTLILPTKFRVNWPLGSGDEEQNKFDRNDFS